VIGIAGPSCSGKTELGRRLAVRLGGAASVLSLDSYYRDLSELHPSARAARNFDRPDSIDRGLLAAQVAALSRGEAVEVPVYDFASHTRTGAFRTVRPGACVVVEGLFVLCWESVRASIDLAVFIDAPHDVCLARRVARDVRERGRTEESVRAQYGRTVRPMFELHVAPTRAFADLTVDGAGSAEEAAAAILARVPPGWRKR
jgi:uridine kinase